MIIEYHPSLNAVPVGEFIANIQKNNFSCRITKDTLHPNASEVMVYCKNRTINT